jgi:hypothetical protein
MDNPANFKDADPDSWMTELCVSLGGSKGNDFLVSGTGTFIGTTLLITAKHVIEDYVYQFQRVDINVLRSRGATEMPAEFAMQAIQLKAGGKGGAIWQVKEAFISPISDIAFLGVMPVQGSPLKRYAKLDFLPPAVGSRVTAFGYRKTRAEGTATEVKWFYVPSHSSGIVKDIHHEARDSHFVNFPSIHTNARFDPGMSGGPIFNESGRLCAIISTGFSPDEVTGQTDSWGALIWPSLNTMLDIPRAGKESVVNYPFYDLCKDGHVTAANLNCVELVARTGSQAPDVKIRY